MKVFLVKTSHDIYMAHHSVKLSPASGGVSASVKTFLPVCRDSVGSTARTVPRCLHLHLSSAQSVAYDSCGTSSAFRTVRRFKCLGSLPALGHQNIDLPLLAHQYMDLPLLNHQNVDFSLLDLCPRFYLRVLQEMSVDKDDRGVLDMRSMVTSVLLSLALDTLPRSGTARSLKCMPLLTCA